MGAPTINNILVYIIIINFVFGLPSGSQRVPCERNPFIQKINYDNPCPGRGNGMAGYYFSQVVTMLLASHCTLGNPDDYPEDFGRNLTDGRKFDFIIVGGGSSGSVVANRLAEISGWKILLVEAGGYPTFESDVPGFYVSLPGREMDWNFGTVNTSRVCLGLENGSCPIFQGRVLGGTSTINNMHYFRGSGQDYDEWESAGNEGWSYEKVLPYFKKSERLDEDFKLVKDTDYESTFDKYKKSFKDDELKLHASSKIAAGKYHSKGGKMRVNHFAYDYSLGRIKKGLCDAAEEIGIPHVADVNWKSQIGCVRAMATLHEASRGNSAKSYLSDVKDRRNLFVATKAEVQKLIVDGKTVKGVVLDLNGQPMSVYATKEVILAAGPINSPRLMLLSGIGPEKDLRSVGVPVTHNLPGVGRNLQSQLSFFGLAFTLDNNDKTRSVSHFEKIDAMYQFISRGEGMFGNVGANDVVTFANTRSNADSPVPDIQFQHYINRVKDYYTFNELLLSLRITNEIRQQFSSTYAKSPVLLVSPTILRPNSRGRVELKSGRYDDPPDIYGGFLADETDVETLIRGIKLAISLMESNSLQEFKPELLDLKIEACNTFAFKSDEYWKCSIKHLATSTYNVAGTCKMGPSKDGMAVVDQDLKVHGIRGLRVADASIMPVINRGSTSVAAVMIGEKVSDLIKKDWKRIKKDEL